jgi:transcriptional regulator with XRE-family HTH domain
MIGGPPKLQRPEHVRTELELTRRAKLKEWFADTPVPSREKAYLGQLILGKEVFGTKAARRIEREYSMPVGFLDGLEAVDELPFGARIRLFRKARNLTQQQVADSVGVSQTAVAAWETGKREMPKGIHLLRLAEVLGFEAGDLLGPTQGISSGAVEEIRLLSAFRTLTVERQRVVIELVEAMR